MVIVIVIVAALRVVVLRMEYLLVGGVAQPVNFNAVLVGQESGRPAWSARSVVALEMVQYQLPLRAGRPVVWLRADLRY